MIERFSHSTNKQIKYCQIKRKKVFASVKMKTFSFIGSLRHRMILSHFTFNVNNSQIKELMTAAAASIAICKFVYESRVVTTSEP